MEGRLGGRLCARDFVGFDSRRTAWDPMIPCYFDTGLVLKLVVKEPLSSAVLDFVRRLRGQELILDFSKLKHQPGVTL